MNKYIFTFAISLLAVWTSAANAKDRTQTVIEQIQKKDAAVMKTLELEYKKIGTKYIIKINDGQPLIKSLKDFCRQKNINFALVSGIGALRKATLGFYMPDKKEFRLKNFSEQLSLSGLSGNISSSGEKTEIHLHAVIADDDFKANAGHLQEAEVSQSVELILETSGEKIQKNFNPETGLILFDFNK